MFKKRLLATFATLTCIVLVQAQNRVELSASKHNFGKIEEMGGDVRCEFVIKNISAEHFVISVVRSGCSCITSRYSRKPIAPHGTDTIQLSFDPRFKVGVLNRTIDVYITGSSQPIKLTICGDVIGSKERERAK